MSYFDCRICGNVDTKVVGIIVSNRLDLIELLCHHVFLQSLHVFLDLFLYRTDLVKHNFITITVNREEHCKNVSCVNNSCSRLHLIGVNYISQHCELYLKN